MKAFAAILLLAIVLPVDAGAVECRAASANDGAYWQWRLIDKRRCWFPGRQKLAKTALHWDVKPIPLSSSRAVSAAGDGGSRRTTPAPIIVYPQFVVDDVPPKVIARWTDDHRPAQAVVRTVQYIRPPDREPVVSWFSIICGAWFTALLAACGVHAIWKRTRWGT
jgi:hypothetical protein